MSMAMVGVSQREIMFEAQRKAAIFSGEYKFIWLTLKDTKYMRMSGIEFVEAYAYIDERAGNIQRFKLDVKTGKTKFDLDYTTNTLRYPMLDSGHNREFLASHYHLGIWKIDDEKIDKEIAAMSKKNEEIVKNEKSDAIKEIQLKESDKEEPKKRGRGKREDLLTDPKIPPNMIKSDLVSVGVVKP